MIRRPGESKLRATLRGLRRVLAATPPDPDPDDPGPATPWEHAADARLRAIEVNLANQNRLLLFTCVSIITDVVLKVAG